MAFEYIKSEKNVGVLTFYLLKYIIALMKVVLEEGRKKEAVLEIRPEND